MTFNPIHTIITLGIPGRYDGRYDEPLLAQCMLDLVVDKLFTEWCHQTIEYDRMEHELREEVRKAFLQQINVRGLMKIEQVEVFVARVELQIENLNAHVRTDSRWCNDVDEIFLVGECPRCSKKVPVPWNHDLINCNEEICEIVLDS